MNLQGLNKQQVEESRQKHGANTLTQIPPEPLWKKILEGFKDPMIMILLVALVIQVVLCFMGEAHWYEPVGILIAIMIANGVSAISENQQEGKASALKAEEEAKEVAKVLRDGKLMEIHVSEVVVGDLVYLQAGDKISADGEIVEGLVKVDQATLNGETKEATKTVNESGEAYNTKDLLNRCYVYRGTVVCSGEAYMEVKVVGDKTLFGELALEVQEDTRETPLQVKLAKLAKQISTFGYIGAIAIVVGVFARTLLGGNIPNTFMEWVNLSIEAITVAVTIIVCAVPEGLPMLTSILLSYQSMRMAKDNVLVHKINGLETAGSLSLLFSDKTGTITEGKLSVVEVATGNVRKFSSMKELPLPLKDEVTIGIGLNNSSSYSNGSIIGGNSTDRALMSFLVDAGVDANVAREDVRNFNAFDSAKKYSTVTINHNGKVVTYIKGAPERIIARCQTYLDENGAVKPLTERNFLMTYMDEQAGRSMRLLGVAKCDGDTADGDSLTLVCVLAIRDNVRKEAVDAIREVQEAGIQVVMVTGDRKETAVAIAKEAGLLKHNTDVALTSAELAELSDDELKKVLPNLRVVSRALPTDKSRLVRCAQELNLVVGMTGDGVNDSPALKRADVGFAMGSGTEAAKEAGKIIILDDNFKSIKDAIWYGRTIYHNILKFCKFQLVINVAAVVVSAIAPFFGVEEPLKVTHLLFVNLVMDGLGAIMLGNEPALARYMREKPRRRDESIISKPMMGQILTMGLWLTVLSFLFLKLPVFDRIFPVHEEKLTAYFVLFIWSALFNGFNVRDDGFGIFRGLNQNTGFMKVFAIIAIVQAAIVNAPLIPFQVFTWIGDMFSCVPFPPLGWVVAIVLAFTMIPVDLIRKAVTKQESHDLIGQSK